MTGSNVVFSKSKKFALRMINMYNYLCSEKKEFIMSKQLLKSGTSIGANIAEAECSISRKEFLSKMYIAFKECAETQYWLEILFESGYIDKKAFDSVMDDCREIKQMLSSITKTTKENRKED